MAESIDMLIDGVGWNFELLVNDIKVKGELPSFNLIVNSSPETEGESRADVRDQDRDHQDEASAESGDEKKADPEPAPEVTEKPNLKRRSPGENVPAKFRFFVEKADELFSVEKIVEAFSALVVDEDYDRAEIIRDLDADVHSRKFRENDAALDPLRVKPRVFAGWLRESSYRLCTGVDTPWVEILLDLFEKIDELIVPPKEEYTRPEAAEILADRYPEKLSRDQAKDRIAYALRVRRLKSLEKNEFDGWSTGRWGAPSSSTDDEEGYL